VITGNSGDDVLVAGTGVDTLIGGTGINIFVVNNSNDVVQDTSTASDGIIQSSVSYATQTNIDTIILSGSANLTATGNSDAVNTLFGNDGNDSLIAGSGNDDLVAGSGADTLIGGSGDDEFDAGTDATTMISGGGKRPSVCRDWQLNCDWWSGQ